jgi:hypothetical protein
MIPLSRKKEAILDEMRTFAHKVGAID